MVAQGLRDCNPWAARPAADSVDDPGSRRYTRALESAPSDLEKMVFVNAALSFLTLWLLVVLVHGIARARREA
ncbi:MAG TPA: hypothetical protein VGR67_01860 [Candidatus Polarisedimenticolia bacterium]|jgi:hypothetical protein|nr:hypothetical protein [Candidatus Polarisedimenticolia bacterium]